MKPIRRALGLLVTALELRCSAPKKLPRLEGVVLYHFPACAFCIKVRSALRHIRVSVQTRDVDSNTRYSDELVSGGGKRQVPCLRIQDHGSERWLYESDEIIRYLRARCEEAVHG